MSIVEILFKDYIESLNPWAFRDYVFDSLSEVSWVHLLCCKVFSETEQMLLKLHIYLVLTRYVFLSDTDFEFFLTTALTYDVLEH